MESKKKTKNGKMEAAIKMKRNSKWLVRIEKKHKLIEAHVEFVNLRRG